MPKFIYKPILDVVKEQWASNTEATFPIEDTSTWDVEITVNAPDEEVAQFHMYPISNILAWELVRTED
jgi:hypothetical protein